MDTLISRDSNEDQPSLNALAAGLGCLVGPALRKCCASVETAKKSQQSLEAYVLKLTSELDKMLEDTPLPMLSQHAARLASVHKRVVSLTASLRLIQGRITSINTLLDSHDTGVKSERVERVERVVMVIMSGEGPTGREIPDMWAIMSMLMTFYCIFLNNSEDAKAETSGASSALPDSTSSASSAAVAQPLNDSWTFLRTTAVQDSSISKAVPDRPMTVVTQDTLSELLMHIKVFNVA